MSDKKEENWYVMDLRTRSLGQRHPNEDSAVKEFNKRKAASPTDHALAVVQLSYRLGRNGLPLNVSSVIPFRLP